MLQLYMISLLHNYGLQFDAASRRIRAHVEGVIQQKLRSLLRRTARKPQPTELAACRHTRKHCEPRAS